MSRTEQQELERGLGRNVQEAKGVLAAHMFGDSKVGSGLSLEDAARAAIKESAVEAERLTPLLEAYVNAINELWLHVENTGQTAKAARMWASTHGRRHGHLDPAEVGVEATFAARGAVTRWPRKGPLFTYLLKAVCQELDHFAIRSASPVELPENIVRRAKGAAPPPGRVSIDEPVDAARHEEDS